MCVSPVSRRTAKENAAGTHEFTFDDKKILEERDGAGDVAHEYTSTLDEYGDLLSDYDGAATAAYQFDALGSTAALLDESASVTDRYVYRAFGEIASHSGTSETPFTFVGRETYQHDSELDLYFATSRHLDPVTGRWVSQDPIRWQAGDENLYRYVRNNPASAVDPSGEQECDENCNVRTLSGWDTATEAEKFIATVAILDPMVVQYWYQEHGWGGNVFDRNLYPAGLKSPPGIQMIADDWGHYFRWPALVTKDKTRGLSARIKIAKDGKYKERAEEFIRQIQTEAHKGAGGWVISKGNVSGEFGQVDALIEYQHAAGALQASRIQLLASLYVEGVMSFTPGAGAILTFRDYAEGQLSFWNVLDFIPAIEKLGAFAATTKRGAAAIDRAADALRKIGSGLDWSRTRLKGIFSKLPDEQIVGLMTHLDDARAGIKTEEDFIRAVDDWAQANVRTATAAPTPTRPPSRPTVVASAAEAGSGKPASSAATGRPTISGTGKPSGHSDAGQAGGGGGKGRSGAGAGTGGPEGPEGRGTFGGGASDEGVPRKERPGGPKVFSKAEYDQWFLELPTRPAPTTRPGQYQRKYAGNVERQVTGGGVEFFTDGLEDSTILETKLIVDPQNSPFIPGTGIPDFLRTKIVGEVEGEFARIAKIVADPANPLKSLEVIVSDQRAVPFFESLLQKYSVPGNVVVRPE